MSKQAQTVEGRLPFHGDETAISFISRFAAWEGHRNLRTFLAANGINFLRFTRGETPILECVAELCAVPSVELEDRFLKPPNQGAAMWSLAGQGFLRRDVVAFPYKVCPDCLTADIQASPDLTPKMAAYGRLAWLFRVTITCPVHNRRLVTIEHEYAHHLDFACQLNNSMHSLLYGPYPTIEQLLTRSKAFSPLDLEPSTVN